MVQMSGGEFTMDYNQDTSVFKASCLGHDVIDILTMVADCAVEPRSVVAANVGIFKNKNKFDIERLVNSGITINDTLFRTAYGLQGLGMPVLGLPSNVEYLNAYTLQNFQIENITSNKIIVGGANVENHNEFVEAVNDVLGGIAPTGDTAVFQRQQPS